jgi:hypothetical protein
MSKYLDNEADIAIQAVRLPKLHLWLDSTTVRDLGGGC